jgi:Tol biopolymer transport system component
MSRQFSTFARFLLLVLAVTAVLALTVHAAPNNQETPRPRFGLEDIPYQAGAENSAPNESALSVTAPNVLLPWSKVAFQSLRNGSWDIFVGNDDGTGQTAVVASGNAEIQPHLNRGNTKIVYASNSGGDYEIYTANFNGSGQTALTSNTTSDGNPSWSPDGSKIVFEAYRNGEADIYVMNADGTNQVRLTTDADFDGMPTWSPDGSKIAFVSRRTGGYRIYVMNADGSGQTQLSNQPYSLRPQWSPDGTQIAYDADGDGDGWQDLWRMNADGGGQTLVVNPGGQTDAWASSWSPDGSRIVYTLISFVYYQGNWYWTYAYPEAWSSGGITRLSTNGLDWDASWQTSDVIAPASQVNALPAQSPSFIAVSWSASDSGGSGAHRYFVQVKVGNGSWTDWLTNTSGTSAGYLGTGGETYAFRVRARDKAFNYEAWPTSQDAVTTVENLPPTTSISALPTYSRYNKDLIVSWSGTDPGSSGIKNYDVQYKVGTSGTWVSWQTGTTETTALLSGGTPEATYYFRVRGTDKAANIESWPAGNGDAQTTFYRWASYGHTFDNTHTPVSSASSTTTPTAASIVPSNTEGSYISYVLGNNTLYTASWSKQGYGSLPTTSFIPEPDGYKALVLPPADNTIANWDFESGSITPEWTITGALPKFITTTTQNTGVYSFGMGTPNANFGSNLSPVAGEYTRPRMAIGPNGETFLFFREVNGEGPNTLFSELLTDGNWTSPIVISSSSTQFGGVAGAAVGTDGAIHLILVSEVLQGSLRKIDLYYTRRSPAKIWSTPAKIYTTTNPYGNSLSNLNMLLTDAGVLHLVWHENIMEGYSTTCGYDVFHMQRSANGTWGSVVNVSQTCEVNSTYSAHVFEQQGKLHFLWLQDYVVYHRIRNANGTWTQPEYVISMGQHTRITGALLGKDGILHLLIGASFKDYGYYLNYQGAWSQGLQLPTNDLAKMATDDLGNIHVGWRDDDSSNIFYLRQTPEMVWLEPERIDEGAVFGYLNLAAEPNGKVHLFWLEKPNGNNDIMYSWKDINDVWTVPENLTGSVEESSLDQLEVDASGNYHLIVSEAASLAYPRYYYWGPTYALAESSGFIHQEVTLSPTLANPILSFMYQLGGVQPNGDSEFVVKINSSNNEQVIYSTKQGTPGWVHEWIDLSAWANEIVTLSFELVQAANHPNAWVYLDEVSLGSTFNDVWVEIENVNGALGETVPIAVSFGNRGGAMAENVEVSLSLPSSVVFMGSNLPSINPTTPTWQIGSLPAKSEVQTIIVYVQIKTSAASFTNFTTTASISTSSNELETLNNTAAGTLFTGKYIYLPMVRK